MVECEICMEKFPIDCFKFFPCTHKLCNFCYNNIKELKCPYCRLDIELSSDDNDDYNYNPPNVINKKKRKKEIEIEIVLNLIIIYLKHLILLIKY